MNKIAKALKTHLAHLLLEEDQGLQVVTKKERTQVKTAGRGTQAELLSAKGRKLEMIMLEVAPGKKGKVRTRTHAGEECYLVMAGNVRISQAEQEYVLGPGDSWHWDASVAHEITNTGKKTARLVVAIVPQAAHILAL